ncbi:MAG: hypothetical protein WC464_02920 [Bdellovibrionales bacterium]
MFTALSTAVTGINQAVARATQSAGNVVNASSTGKDIARDMVNINVAKTEVAANATVIKTQNEMGKTLLNIIA